MEDVSTLIARQYEAYAYPPPFDDVAAWMARGNLQMGDPAFYAPLLWPERPAPKAPRILVAGCGTVQAASFAFSNRGAEVVGVDLSEASLAHERFLQERHALSNLKLYKGDLREAASLGRDFDVVFATGVLHHMADPGEGLRALGDVLAPDGVLVGMVYGATRRTGVTMLQDAFRRLGVEADVAGVAFVRRTLAALPQTHFVHWYARAAEELKHDEALVDTFLNPQERAYTVPQLLDWIEGNGLAFQGWIDNGLYFPDGLFDVESELGAALKRLPDREQWAAVEMLTLLTGTHTFITCKPARAAALPRISFEGEDWRALVAHRTPGVVRVGERAYQRGRMDFTLHPAEALLFDSSDGRRTIAELLAHPELASHDAAAREAFGRSFFETGWKVGHIALTR